MTEEEKKFYDSFEVKIDKVTIDRQLTKIKNKMYENLCEKYGVIVPKQTREQLLEQFETALNELGY